MNRRNRTIVALATFLVVMSVGIGTAIAVTLFYHHMPAVGVGQTMTPNCDPPTANPATVTIGSSGQITFLCSTASAITVAGSSITVKPIFLDGGFRAPYTELWISNATRLPNPYAGRLLLAAGWRTRWSSSLVTGPGRRSCVRP